MKKDNEKMRLMLIVIFIATLVSVVVILTAVNIKKGGESDHYDMECLTAPLQKPLSNCKM